MSDNTAESILGEIQKAPANVVSLLQTYHTPTYETCWQGCARLYREFGYELLKAGQPTMAFELAREGLLAHGGDHELLFLSALALARGRNVQKAKEYLDDLLNLPDLDVRLRVEGLSLAARLMKDRYEAGDAASRPGLASKAAQLYQAAYQLTAAAYPAINAATMSLLAGQPQEHVQRWAQNAILRTEQEQQLPGRADDYWLLATFGEAHLLLGHDAEAAKWYQQAAAQAAGRLGEIASMRRQLQLLQDRLPAAREILTNVGHGTVVVFVGHAIDRPGPAGPDRPALRFPPDPRLEERVRRAIEEELDRLDPVVGYCSGACGSDLLFAELMLKRKKELHLVLPFLKSDFHRTSVDYGLEDMAEYRRRFDAVAAQAEVHHGTGEAFLGEEGLLEFAGAFGRGLGVLRAAELRIEPWTLAVVDRNLLSHQGAIKHFLEGCDEQGDRSRIIDLAKLRQEVAPQPPDWWEKARPAPEPPAGRLRREIKVMLFADVKNYSSLTDQQAPAFFGDFLGEVNQAVRDMRRYPAMCNTWGDGLFLVFNQVLDGAEFALGLMERIQKIDFARLGLPIDTTIRIGLHAGPVYPQWDQLIGRVNYFGTHVNRAARIEPKTPPGCVYTSEQFAALLANEPRHDFVCEYAGLYRLGKEHDQFHCTLYRLRRRRE